MIAARDGSNGPSRLLPSMFGKDTSTPCKLCDIQSATRYLTSLEHRIRDLQEYINHALAVLDQLLHDVQRSPTPLCRQRAVGYHFDSKTERIIRRYVTTNVFYFFFPIPASLSIRILLLIYRSVLFGKATEESKKTFVFSLENTLRPC
jgi:hypothetical protein